MEVRYCKVCRVHCEDGRKHKYSKKHAILLKKIVEKFADKVSGCKKFLDSPEVIDGELEPNASFWCHFCDMKVAKHITNGTVSVKFGGVFEHFASSMHRKRTHEFWKLNGGDRNRKKDFLISDEDYLSYKERCKKALDAFSLQEDVLEMQIADEIRSRDAERLKIVSDQSHFVEFLYQTVETVKASKHVSEQDCFQLTRCDAKPLWLIKKDKRHFTVERKRTLPRGNLQHFKGAYSSLPALSAVIPLQANKSVGKPVGNIHTGAVPPWLQNDDSNESSAQPVIGPSHEDFLRHSQKTNKKKPNMKSVGANFDHSAATTDDWLPSFGRVWNSGPRWQSRKEYRNEKQKTGTRSHQEEQ